MCGCDNRGRRLVVHRTDTATITPVLEATDRQKLSRSLRHLTGPDFDAAIPPHRNATGKFPLKQGQAISTGSLIFAQFAIRGSSKAAYCRNGPSTLTGRHNNKGEPGEAFSNDRRSRAGDRRGGPVWLFERQEEQYQRIVERDLRGDVEWLLDSEGHHRRQRPERARHYCVH